MNRPYTFIFTMLRFLTILVLATTLPGCQSSDKSRDPSSGTKSNMPSRRIVTASYALKYLTQRLVGESVVVECPAAESLAPGNWSPGLEDIAAMQKADLIVINGQGAEYAKWIAQTTLPRRRICQSCEDVPLKSLIPVADFQLVHSHGPEGEHSHAYMVPTTWLDPETASIQARTIAHRLVATYPELRSTIEANLKDLLGQFQELPKPNASTIENRPAVLTVSPEYKYATRAAGLQDHHLLWFDEMYEQGRESALQKLRKKIADSHAIALITSNMPEEEVQRICTDEDVEIVIVDLLERQPSAGDYFTLLRDNLNRLIGLHGSAQ